MVGPTIKLTDSTIQRLQAPLSGSAEVPDHIVVGLRLRVGRIRKTWLVRKRIGAKVKNHILGHYPGLGLRDARDAARKWLEGIENGGAVRRVVTFDVLAEEFIRDHAKPKIRTWREVEARMKNHVLPHWKGKRIDAITRQGVQALVDGIAVNTEIAANRALANIKTIFQFALRRGYLDINPADAVVRPGKENVRDRWLDEGEIKAFWQATGTLGYPYRHYLRVLLLTGQRRTEVASMKWADLDLDKGEWILQAADTKAARQHLVPLSPAAIKVLGDVPRLAGKDGKPSPYVFTTGQNYIQSHAKAKALVDARMTAILEKEGRTLAHWQLHDLRRTMASHSTRLGVSEEIVGKILNHAPAKGVTGRHYNIYSYAPEKKHALEAWAAEVMRLVGEAAPGNVVSMRGRK